MTDQPKKDESPISERSRTTVPPANRLAEKQESQSSEHKQKTVPPSRRPWNPFASMRMTISPSERLALLKMPLPLLPPEDFMNPVERAKLARARRRPVIIKLLVLFGVATIVGLFGGLLWSRAPRPDAIQPKAQPMPAATLAAVSDSQSATSVSANTATAETSPVPQPPIPTDSARTRPEQPSEPQRKLSTAAAQPAASSPKSEPHATTAKKPTLLTPAPSNSPSTAPHPDFKTPW